MSYKYKSEVYRIVSFCKETKFVPFANVCPEFAVHNDARVSPFREIKYPTKLQLFNSHAYSTLRIIFALLRVVMQTQNVKKETEEAEGKRASRKINRKLALKTNPIVLC